MLTSDHLLENKSNRERERKRFLAQISSKRPVKKNKTKLYSFTFELLATGFQASRTKRANMSQVSRPSKFEKASPLSAQAALHLSIKKVS